MMIIKLFNKSGIKNLKKKIRYENLKHLLILFDFILLHDVFLIILCQFVMISNQKKKNLM
jgi:hypothetical protein